MNEIYVSGHRNPDTDSIVASMAYARLRNALGDKWGSRVAWYYWINFPLWIASLATLFPDILGMGFGFEFNTLTVIGIVREILGSGSVFGWKFIPGDGILAFVMAPGAFMVLGYLMVLFNKYLKK